MYSVLKSRSNIRIHGGPIILQTTGGPLLLLLHHSLIVTINTMLIWLLNFKNENLKSNKSVKIVEMIFETQTLHFLLRLLID